MFCGIKMLDLKESTPEFGQQLLLFGDGRLSLGRLEHILISEKGTTFSFLEGDSSFENVYPQITHYLPANFNNPMIFAKKIGE